MFGRLRNWLSGPQKRGLIVDRGIIKRRDRSISLEEWNKLIESHPTLEPVPDRYGTSPFTGEQVLFSGKGKACCIINGEIQGTLCHFDGELSVTAVPERFCDEIADLLKAEVLHGDDAYLSE